LTGRSNAAASELLASLDHQDFGVQSKATDLVVQELLQ